MKLKIKSIPSDFVVEEIAGLPLKKKGEFAAYLLRKKGWNTVDLLRKISRELKIPFKYFSYGGRKDKHALTSQYITVKRPEIIKLNESFETAFGYSLKFCGFMERPMGPDLIEGNKFEITIRELAPGDIEGCLREIDIAKKTGYPNYFDDQRFGSFNINQGFLAEKILKGHFNGALKIYLTSINDSDKKDEKQRKKFFFENWKDWGKCREAAFTAYEKTTFDYLIKHPKDFLALLRGIPRNELSSYFSAYQSYLWNEMLRRIVIKNTPAVKIYAGKTGDYVFYDEIKKEDSLDSLEIPTVPIKNCIDEIYNQVLKDNELRYSMFNNLKTRQAFFKSALRKAIVKPGDLQFNTADDELYPGKKKLVLKFMLPRGSYGTMLLKKLFSS